MAVFTSLQADAFVVTQCEAETKDGVHTHYSFAGTHNGFDYQWNDTDLASGASKAQIKTAIHDYLTSTAKKTKPPVRGIVTDSNDVIGNTVGSL